MNKSTPLSDAFEINICAGAPKRYRDLRRRLHFRSRPRSALLIYAEIDGVLTKQVCFRTLVTDSKVRGRSN